MNQPEAVGAVADLIGRYLLTLDTEKPDSEWALGLFTPDIVIEFPMSRHAGIEGIGEYHADMLSAFAATQHLSSAPLVEVAGESAGFRANVVSIHVHHPEPAPAADPPGRFSAGTLLRGEALLTAAGWRLRRMTFQVVWTEGRPPSR